MNDPLINDLFWPTRFSLSTKDDSDTDFVHDLSIHSRKSSSPDFIDPNAPLCLAIPKTSISTTQLPTPPRSPTIATAVSLALPTVTFDSAVSLAVKSPISAVAESLSPRMSIGGLSPLQNFSSLLPSEFAENPVLARALATGAPKRPRGEKKPIPPEQKDDKYFERRKRNNLAAKKSRDARKAREDQIAVRANFLEKENAILRAQLTMLKDEATSLRNLLVQKRQRTL